MRPPWLARIDYCGGAVVVVVVNGEGKGVSVVISHRSLSIKGVRDAHLLQESTRGTRSTPSLSGPLPPLPGASLEQRAHSKVVCCLQLQFLDLDQL